MMIKLIQVLLILTTVATIINMYMIFCQLLPNMKALKAEEILRDRHEKRMQVHRELLDSFKTVEFKPEPNFSYILPGGFEIEANQKKSKNKEENDEE